MPGQEESCDELLGDVEELSEEGSPSDILLKRVLRRCRWEEGPAGSPWGIRIALLADWDEDEDAMTVLRCGVLR